MKTAIAKTNDNVIEGRDMCNSLQRQRLAFQCGDHGAARAAFRSCCSFSYSALGAGLMTPPRGARSGDRPQRVAVRRRHAEVD
jgi:hypothetical protein